MTHHKTSHIACHSSRKRLKIQINQLKSDHLPPSQLVFTSKKDCTQCHNAVLKVIGSSLWNKSWSPEAPIRINSNLLKIYIYNALLTRTKIITYHFDEV